MKDRRTNYGIALDIGVSSVGWAAIDPDSRLLKIHGHSANGVRLFDEGHTAADRRWQRSTRRTYRRKKQRLRELDRSFAPHIQSIDPDFFQRRKYAGRKSHRKYPNRLFHDISDRAFRKRYPTVYHLRAAIMQHPEHRFDIRAIYLALHHIVKHRGNFLMSGKARDFSVDRIDWKKELSSLFHSLQAYYPNHDFRLATRSVPDVRTACLAQGIVARMATDVPHRNADTVDSTVRGRLRASYPDLAERLAQSRAYNVPSLLNRRSLIPDIAKRLTVTDDARVQKATKALVRAILGSDFRIEDLFPTTTAEQSLKVNIESWDDHLEDISSRLAGLSNVGPVVDTIKRLHAAIVLKRFLANSRSISEHMVQIYQNKVARDRGDTSISPDDTKQRKGDNGVLPYQLQQLELDAIIRGQGKYYPFLREPNPVVRRRPAFPYRLDELVGFKVPYYVGPLVSREQSPFAWMVRKNKHDHRAITPWNFYDQVDLVATSRAFMERLKTTDDIWLGAPVLAKHTLLYQDYCVLNELNKVKIRNRDTGAVHRLNVSEKQGIYRACFRAKKVVHVADVLDYLRDNFPNEYSPQARLTVLGLSQSDTFSNGLTVYRDLYRIYGTSLDEWLRDRRYRQEFDHVLEAASTFQNAHVFRTQLARWSYPFLVGHRDAWSHLLYQGWGRLSASLLSGVTNHHGETVIDRLWKTNDNFMQIIHQSGFATAIEAHNREHIQHHGIRATIHDMYTSPQNKRAILQAILVVRDIAQAQGHAPSWVFLETARDTRHRSYQPKSRLQRLKRQIQHLDPLVRKELQSFKKSDNVTTRQLLYFQQDGRDIYDRRKRLDLRDLSQYDIDHVLPRSLVQDDSLDNRVLTSKRTNAAKGNSYFAREVSDESTVPSWKALLAKGLITNRKYDNLMMTSASFAGRINEFTARQLVETRQIIKLVTQMVSFTYPRTEVIDVKAGLSSKFRQTFGFPKNRDVNDYHHAFDAYLAGMIGNYFRRRSSYWHRFISNDDYNWSSAKHRHIARSSDEQSLNFIYQMAHAQYRDRHHSPVIYDEDHRHIIWDKQRDLAYLHSVYDNPHILITHRTYERFGSLFNETKVPAKRATQKTIPLKEGLSPAQYGGYTSIHFAYYVLVQERRASQHKQRTKVKLLSIPTKLAIQMGQATTAHSAHQLLLAYTRRELMSNKDYARGRQERYHFTFFRDAHGHVVHIPYEQSFVYIDAHGGHYTRRISGNWRDNSQLYLPLKVQRVLASSQLTSDGWDHIFDEVCDKLDRGFPGFNHHQIAKITRHRDWFYRITSPDKKRHIFRLILQSVHSDGTFKSFKDINGMSGTFGKMGFNTATTLSPTPRYILYQSPSGLFTHQVPIRFGE